MLVSQRSGLYVLIKTMLFKVFLFITIFTITICLYSIKYVFEDFY